LCIARCKDPVLGRVIAQSSYQLIGFLRGHFVDVLAELVHALNFTQKAINHRRRPFFLILSTSAQIFSVVSNRWPHLMDQFKSRLMGDVLDDLTQRR
jgi:hypothetical protein